MSLELVDTPKELVEEYGSKCLMGTDKNGQVFFTKAQVTFIELMEDEDMKNLTVAQMIEELKKMPQDALVVVSGEDSSWGICQAVHTDDIVDLVLNEEL